MRPHHRVGLCLNNNYLRLLRLRRVNEGVDFSHVFLPFAFVPGRIRCCAESSPSRLQRGDPLPHIGRLPFTALRLLLPRGFLRLFGDAFALPGLPGVGRPAISLLRRAQRAHRSAEVAACVGHGFLLVKGRGRPRDGAAQDRPLRPSQSSVRRAYG
jgi:hypothetical protein